MSTDAAIIIFSGLALLGGYLIGSIPSGLLLAKLFRLKEIPKNLDGCVSLASLWQSKHWFVAIFTIILELVKIVITVFLMGIIMYYTPYYEATRYCVPHRYCSVLSVPIDIFGMSMTSDELIRYLTFWGMFIGQIFPLFTKFKGSTGIWIFYFIMLISFLISLAIKPVLIAIIITIWGLTLLFSRYLCIATLTSLIIFPFIIYIYALIWDPILSHKLIGFYIIYSLFALLVILGHRGHIARLLKGQEPKLSLWKKS